MGMKQAEQSVGVTRHPTNMISEDPMKVVVCTSGLSSIRMFLQNECYTLQASP